MKTLTEPDYARLAALGFSRERIDADQEHRRAKSSHFRGYAKADTGRPDDVKEFVLSGGMRRLEYVAAAQAADEAKRYERAYWLPLLERWLEALTVNDLFDAACQDELVKEIRRLRRILKVKPPPPTPEQRRAATRERVRRHRERVKSVNPLKGTH